MQAGRPVIELLTDATLLAPLMSPERTLLLIVDVQEDFVGPSGAAARWGADLESLKPRLANIEALIATARRNSVATAFARVVTRPETDSAALKTLHRLKGHLPDAVAICRAGTHGADYHRVRPEPGDIEIEKTLYSCFAGTDLDARLRAHGIATLVVAGFTTDCCVDSTARDGFHRGYNVLVVADACGAYESYLHDGSLAALSQNCATLTDTETALAIWR